MSNIKVFKIKYYLTYILCGIITLLFLGSIIITQFNYSKLKTQYNNCFLDVTKNFEKVYFNSMSPSGEINIKLNDLDLNNEATIQEITRLKSILIEMESFNYSRKKGISLTSYYRYIDVQNDLELLLELTQKYSNERTEMLESDTEDIIRAYIHVRAFRGVI